MPNSYLRQVAAGTPNYGNLDQASLKALAPIAGSAVQLQNAPNRYTNSQYTYDPAALQKSLSGYNAYDPSAFGGLAEYFKQKAAANVGGQLLYKPEDYAKVAGGLGTLPDKSMLPLLGNLQGVGQFNDKTFYDKAALQAQLDKYGVLTPEQQKQFASLPGMQGIKPLATAAGNQYYDRNALQGAMKNMYGNAAYNPKLPQINDYWTGGPKNGLGLATSNDALRNLGMQKTYVDNPFQNDQASDSAAWLESMKPYKYTGTTGMSAFKAPEVAHNEATARAMEDRFKKEFEALSSQQDGLRMPYDQWIAQKTDDFATMGAPQPLSKAEQIAAARGGPDVYGQLVAKQNEAFNMWAKDNTSQQLDQELRSLYPTQSYTTNQFTGNHEDYLNTVNHVLHQRGIKSLSQIGNKDGKLYDKATGRPINATLGNFQGGTNDGNLMLSLKWNDKLGVPVIGTDFNKPSAKMRDYVEAAIPGIILGMVAGPAGAALGGSLGGGTTGAILGNALAYGTAGGVGSAIQGGNFGEGFLTGAAGGALGGAGSAIKGMNAGQALLGAGSPAWAQGAINQGISGALTGGAKGGLKGALSGGLGGAVGGGLGSYVGGALQNSSPMLQNLGKIGTSTLTGGLQSALAGQGFGKGAVGSLAGGLANIGQNYVASQLGDSLLPKGALQNTGANVLGGITNQFIRNQLMNALNRG